MKIKLSRLNIRVAAGGQTFSADLVFGDGLNVIRADNTSGKSTCINSIMWVLGLEGMLGPEKAVHLPPAMTSEIEDEDGNIHGVTESHVTLEMRRSDGHALTIRRLVVGEASKDIIRVWEGEALSSPTYSIVPKDFYVRRSGAAREERGFHHYIAEWLDWTLAEVTRLDGTSGPLYVEAFSPLWIVEQKRGWAGIQALAPNYLRISDVKRRSLEYLLSLDVMERRSRLQELERETADIRSKWSETRTALLAAIKHSGAVAREIPVAPTGAWPFVPAPYVAVARDESWLRLSEAVREARERVTSIEAVRMADADGRSVNSDELEQAEAELQRVIAIKNHVTQAISRDQAAREATETRLATIKQDRRRHKDLLLLRNLGSDDESLLQIDMCPVCKRELGDVLLDEEVSGAVMSVEATIDYLGSQAELAKMTIDSTAVALESQEAERDALRHGASELRSRVSTLRMALTGDGRSMVDAQEILNARHQLVTYEDMELAFEEALNDFEVLSRDWGETQAKLSELRATRLSDLDSAKLSALQAEFVAQLVRYGFESIPPSALTVSKDSYQPIHEGYDPAFESSASDAVRIIWAYLLALRHVSNQFGLNHPGLIIFDEPRQQMAAKLSFQELLSRAAEDDDQTLFATSESAAALDAMLVGLASNRIEFEGKILKLFGSHESNSSS